MARPRNPKREKARLAQELYRTRLQREQIPEPIAIDAALAFGLSSLLKKEFTGTPAHTVLNSILSAAIQELSRSGYDQSASVARVKGRLNYLKSKAGIRELVSSGS